MKYFDVNYDRNYFFDNETNESIWVLPEGINEDKDILDCTEKVNKSEAEAAQQEEDKNEPDVSAVEVKEDEELRKYQAYKSSVD